MKLDKEARYAETHEWARKDGDLVTVGISDHAQDSLGAIVFVELPATGAVFKAGASFGVVESVKAASDVYIPLSGTIAAVNDRLSETPELINKDCYGEGWIVKLTPSGSAEWDKLLSPEDYEKTASEE
jgi:glycine cleavage system H protein